MSKKKSSMLKMTIKMEGVRVRDRMEQRMKSDRQTGYQFQKPLFEGLDANHTDCMQELKKLSFIVF